MIVATCELQNYDIQNNTCSLVEFKEFDSFLPPLSIAEAGFIGTSIITIWCLGFGFKLVRKYLMR